MLRGVDSPRAADNNGEYTANSDKEGNNNGETWTTLVKTQTTLAKPDTNSEETDINGEDTYINGEDTYINGEDTYNNGEDTGRNEDIIIASHKMCLNLKKTTRQQEIMIFFK